MAKQHEIYIVRASSVPHNGGSVVPVGANSTLIAAANKNRIFLAIQNISTSAIDLKFGGAAVVGAGFRLNPASGAGKAGDSLVISQMGLFTGAVYGIDVDGAGNKNVTVTEI